VKCDATTTATCYKCGLTVSIHAAERLREERDSLFTIVRALANSPGTLRETPVGLELRNKVFATVAEIEVRS
jgi:hypothetical protein